jgi:hypothetical protein
MSGQHIEIGCPEGATELEIVARSLRVAFDGRGIASSLIPAAEPHLTLTRGRQVIRLDWDGGRTALVDRDYPLVIPVVVHADTIPRMASRSSRVCFGTRGSARSARMAGRVVAEMHRRGARVPTVVAGPQAPDWADECFPVLEGPELLRLLVSARCFVDTGWEEDDGELVTAIAVACGVPVVAHASRRLPGGRSVVPVAEWSADAFCDAILAPPREQLGGSVAPAETAADEILGAFAFE